MAFGGPDVGARYGEVRPHLFMADMGTVRGGQMGPLDPRNRIIQGRPESQEVCGRLRSPGRTRRAGWPTDIVMAESLDPLVQRWPSGLLCVFY